MDGHTPFLWNSTPDLVLVDGHDVLRNPVVQHVVWLVNHHVQQVKPATHHLPVSLPRSASSSSSLLQDWVNMMRALPVTVQKKLYTEGYHPQCAMMAMGTVSPCLIWVCRRHLDRMAGGRPTL